MKRAQALFAGILLSFLLISSIVSASITVTAPDTAEPGQIIIIQAAVPPGATNVTLHYKICTATSCGLPLTASMSLSTSTPPSEDLYEATIPAQEDGNEVEYSVTADVDGSTETSQEGKILVRSSSEAAGHALSDREVEVAVGLVAVVISVVIALSLKRKGAKVEVAVGEKEGGGKDEQ